MALRWSCDECLSSNVATDATCRFCSARKPNAASSNAAVIDVDADEGDDTASSIAPSHTAASNGQRSRGAAARIPVSSLGRGLPSTAANLDDSIASFSDSQSLRASQAYEDAGDSDEDGGGDDAVGDGSGGGGGAGHKRRRGGKVSAEEKAARAAEREAERASKKAKKEADKAAERHSKAAQKVTERAAKGGYAHSEVGLALSVDLASRATGEALTAALASQGCTVLLPEAHTLMSSIHWRRGRLAARRAGGGAGGATSAASAASAASAGSAGAVAPAVQFEEAGVEPFIGILLDGERYVDMLRANRLAGTAAWVNSCKAGLPRGCKVTLFVLGLRHALQNYGAKVQRRQERAAAAAQAAVASGYAAAAVAASDAAAAAASEYPAIHLPHIDAWNSALYVQCDVDIVMCELLADLAEHIARMTTAIAEAPYRAAPTALACTVKVKVAKSGTYTGADGKKTLAGTWWSMLQMIPGLSANKASAVVAAYPTLRSLVEAYQRAESVDVAARLLETVLSGDKKKETKLSREVYTFFTTADPQTVIGRTG